MTYRRVVPLLGLALLALLPLYRPFLRFPVEVQLSGHLMVEPGNPPVRVELWFPELRLWVDQRGNLWSRDENGELHAWREPGSEVETRLSAGGVLSVRLQTRCWRQPRHCTLSVHQAGTVTRYAWLVPLEAKEGILVGKLPRMARVIPREAEVEDPNP